MENAREEMYRQGKESERGERKGQKEENDRRVTRSRERDGGIMELDKMPGGVWGWRSQMGMKSCWGRCKVRGRENAKDEDRAIDGGRDPCRGRENP